MTTLLWFINDLRVDDNLALNFAIQQKQVICVYFMEQTEEYTFQPALKKSSRMGPMRKQFLLESLAVLQNSLDNIGLRLLVFNSTAQEHLPKILTYFNITQVCRSKSCTYNESFLWKSLKASYPAINWREFESETLFDYEQIPISSNELPSSFTQFRKKIEKYSFIQPIAKPTINYKNNEFNEKIDTFLQAAKASCYELHKINVTNSNRVRGGENAANAQLNEYFSSNLPSIYKTVRNEIDGWANSTKFSFWLANGCLSVRRLALTLKDYETAHISNESTYWIYFELLWREYFHLYSRKYGKRLFRFEGISKTRPLTSFYSTRFHHWCMGTTPSALVNACMHQLTISGYLSNRGRQIVASYLVNELQVDWRYGAAYFEYHLIDYDCASNWGNWQYIAGVGADPRGGRHFNIEKQQTVYDPESHYIQRWQGESNSSQLDLYDAADWPCEP